MRPKIKVSHFNANMRLQNTTENRPLVCSKLTHNRQLI